jgi:hypothetical protein
MKKIQVLERSFKAAKKAKIFVCLVQYIIYYINWKTLFLFAEQMHIVILIDFLHDVPLRRPI